MQIDDHLLYTQNRTQLLRAWVDMSCLDFGVTNGVAYFQGTFRHHLSKRQLRRDERLKIDEVDMVKRLERSVRQIPGVRDCIFRLDNLRKHGSAWKEV